MLAPDSPNFSDADLPFLEWDDSLAALDVADAAAALDAGGWDFDSEDVFGGGVLAVVEGAGETPPSLGPPCLEPISVSQAIGESGSSNSSGGVPWWNEMFEEACDSLEAEGCASSAPQPAAPLLRRSASGLTTGRCKRGWTQSKEGLSATVIPLHEQELRTTEQESLGGGEPASDHGSLDVHLGEAAGGRSRCATDMELQWKPSVECQGPLLEGDDELRRDVDDDEDATAATKRQKRLVRNRESALQSRQRRKSYVRELEGRCALLERQLGHLQQCVSVTAAENHAMQAELQRLAHLRTGVFHKNAQPLPHAPHGAGQPSEKSTVIGDTPAEPAVLESDSLPPESLPAHCQSRTPRGALPLPCGAPSPLPYTWWQRLAGGPFPSPADDPCWRPRYRSIHGFPVCIVGVGNGVGRSGGEDQLAGAVCQSSEQASLRVGQAPLWQPELREKTGQVTVADHLAGYSAEIATDLEAQHKQKTCKSGPFG
eukprot:SM000039S14435  [mRNA]  locus=s39:163352:165726:+ [translate_table: standard]